MASRVLQVCSFLAMVAGAVPAGAQCSWRVLPSGINFGAYNVFGGASSTSTINGTVRCVGRYDVTVSSTTGGAGVYNPRKMNGTADYNVYIEGSHTLIWGNGTAGTNVYAFQSGNGTNDYSGSAFGLVPGAQDLATGAYSDTLTSTLSYRPANGGAWVSRPPVSFPVSMTVTPSCRIDTFTLNFGNYAPLSGTAANQTTPVKVYCTRNTTATFALNNGANPSGLQKRLRSGVNYLNYTATLASGSGTSTSSLVPISGGVTLSGTIPASQDVPIGNFIDTLQVVVNY
jgi:spore coat protein U-like protein